MSHVLSVGPGALLQIHEVRGDLARDAEVDCPVYHVEAEKLKNTEAN